MKKGKIRYYILIVFLVAIAISVIAVIAQNANQSADVPVLPAVYYGKLSIGNNAVKDGLKIEAFVDGNSCGQKAETKDSMYLIVIRGNDVLTPGCADTDQDVSIEVNGVKVADVKWSSGLVTKNDIKLEPSNLKGDISKLVGNAKTK